MPNVTPKCGCCFLVPLSVLRRLAQAGQIETADRGRYQRSYATTQKLRLVREAIARLRWSAIKAGLSLRATAVAKMPVEHLFDCKHTTTLPGTAVPTPADPAFKTVFETTAKVAEFYKTVLGRNSIDNQGADLVSSLNYDRDYQNAFWDGQQMVYGNADNKIFSDFWRSPDVIGHELTHGLTQHESGLLYEGQSGALNESISDCFGAAFAQWLAKKPASDAGGWLIGAGIMGPEAKAKGFNCLRDMVNPSAPHCLSPQPVSYKDFDPTADVHDNSGIPNRAFALFAQNLGGNTYDMAIKVWHDACVSGLPSRATFVEFAQATVAAAQKKGPAVAKAATDAWHSVDLSVGLPDNVQAVSSRGRRHVNAWIEGHEPPLETGRTYRLAVNIGMVSGHSLASAPFAEPDFEGEESLELLVVLGGHGFLVKKRQQTLKLPRTGDSGVIYFEITPVLPTPLLRISLYLASELTLLEEFAVPVKVAAPL